MLTSPPNCFDDMARMAQRYAAIDLAAGTADFDPPAALLAAAGEALRAGPNQYSPSAGLPLLRSAIAHHVREQYGLAYDPESEITVSAGATGGIWAALRGLLNAGDEALIVQPCLDLYRTCTIAAGASVRFVGGRHPNERLPLDELEQAFGPRTRLLIVCTPANPSGICLTSAEIAALGRLAERHNAVIVSDETYDQILLDGAEHVPVASDRHCHDRTVTVSSISKTFAASGWRVGWVLAPPRLTDAVRAAHRLAVLAAPSPLQWATARMLETAAKDGYFTCLRGEMSHRCRILEMFLLEAGLKPHHPTGAFYLLAQVPGDGANFCQQLVSEAGVVAMPGAAFFHCSDAGRQFVRFAFCKREQTLQEAGARLVAYARLEATGLWR
jgi:N-succinyldiaminopimelate aminotransferase